MDDGDFLETIWQKMHLSGPPPGALKASRLVVLFEDACITELPGPLPAAHLNTFALVLPTG